MMGNTQKTYLTTSFSTARTIVGALGGTVLVVALAACSTAAPEAAESSAPTASATATPTQSATPEPTWDPAGTAAWAAEVVPTGGSDGFIRAQNGHIDAGSPGAFTLQDNTLPAGSYSLYFACRGDADTTVTVAVVGDEAATMSGGCAGEAAGMDITTATDGATFTVIGDPGGEAVDWALALTDLLPKADG